MRAIRAIGSILLAAGLLVSCGAKAPAKPPEEPTPPAETEPVAPPEEPTPQAQETLIYTVETDSRQSAVRNGSEELAVCSLQLPVLGVYRGDGSAVEEGRTEKETAALAAAEAFNGEFAKLAEEMEAEYDEMILFAQEQWEAFHAAQESVEFMPHSQTFTFSVYRLGSLLSVSGFHDYYGGGPHPVASSSGWNFDLETGAFVSVPTLAKDTLAFRDAVTAEIIARCRENAADFGMEATEMYWENYEQIAADWDQYAVTFDEEGMTVTFSVYEMAAYVMGAQAFDFSYDWLRPYLGELGA